MNLPQNIQKLDGAIARSFSEELGLNLDLKTNRSILWASNELRGLDGHLIMQNGKTLVTIDKNKIGIWDYETKRLLRVFEQAHEVIHEWKDKKHIAKLNESEFILNRKNDIGTFNIKQGIYKTISPIHNSIFSIHIDKSLLAFLCNKNTIKVYETTYLNQIATILLFDADKTEKGSSPCKNIFFSEDGNYLGVSLSIFKREISKVVRLYPINDFGSYETIKHDIKEDITGITSKGELTTVKINNYDSFLTKYFKNRRETYVLTNYNSDSKDFIFLNKVFNPFNGEILTYEYNFKAPRYIAEQDLKRTKYLISVSHFLDEIAFYDMHTNELQSIELPKYRTINNYSSRSEKDFMVGDIKFLKDDLWLISSGNFNIIYDSEKKIITKQFIFDIYGSIVSLNISEDLKTAVGIIKGTLYCLDIESNRMISERKIEAPHYLKRTHNDISDEISKVFFLNNDTLLLVDIVEIEKKEKKSEYYIQLSQLNINLDIIKSKTLNIRASKTINFSRFLELTKDKAKLFLFSDFGGYIIDTDSFSHNQLKATVQKEYYQISANFSDKYMAIYGSSGIQIFDVNTENLIGEVVLNDKSPLKFIQFDDLSNLLIFNNQFYTTFYRLQPFSKIGEMHVETNGDFQIEILPDETSPNGWFYTNVPERVSVLKSKADGSEPELLPIDDEERLAFITHHNRKDIVTNKLFEPKKYEEFVKLNANAEKLAVQDMVIELSEVETKKLDNRT